MIDPQKISRHLDYVSRPRDAFENYRVLEQIQNYIREEFNSYGYEVEPQVFEFNGAAFSNWIARKPGSSDIPEFIVGAHFDSVPGTPGADDNASGVAAMLEIARCAFRFPVNVHFVAFNLEEYNMIGSLEYVKELSRKMTPVQKQKFLGMVSLEMIGYTDDAKGSQKMPLLLKPFYPDTGNFLALVGDDQSEALLRKAKPCFEKGGASVYTLTAPVKGKLFPEVRLSDHSAFWDMGFPALLVTDTSFFRNPNYHTEKDTVTTLDQGFLRQTAEGCLHLLQSLKPA